MSGRQLSAWFAAAFLAGLLLALPLQLVLPRLAPSGLAATAVDGSLWRGHLHTARWNGVELGNLRLGLAPLSLLTGSPTIHLGGTQADAALATGRRRGLAGADGVLPLPPIAGLRLRASLEDARLLFDGEGCHGAGGRVRIEARLPGDAAPPLVLSGTPACHGRSGRLELLPEQAGGAVQLSATLSVDADGSYVLQTQARSDDPGIRAILLASGFQDVPGGLSRVDDGRIGG